MILVSIRMTVNPEQRDEFLQIIRGVLGPTRAERTCTHCKCYEDIENKNTFIYIEEWQTKPGFNRHISSEIFRNILAAIDMSCEPPEINFNTVSRTEGLETVAAVRGEHSIKH